MTTCCPVAHAKRNTWAVAMAGSQDEDERSSLHAHTHDCGKGDTSQGLSEGERVNDAKTAEEHTDDAALRRELKALDARDKYFLQNEKIRKGVCIYTSVYPCMYISVYARVWKCNVWRESACAYT